jgi:hypothetical protein
VFKVSAAATADKDFTRALDTTESLVRALRARKPHKSAPLNLKTDFYDPSTGLHSVAQFSHWYRQLGADGERKRGRARHARSAAAVELGSGASRVLPRLWRAPVLAAPASCWADICGPGQRTITVPRERAHAAVVGGVGVVFAAEVAVAGDWGSRLSPSSAAFCEARHLGWRSGCIRSGRDAFAVLLSARPKGASDEDLEAAWYEQKLAAFPDDAALLCGYVWV